MVADSVSGVPSSRTTLPERKNRPRLGVFSCGCDVEGMLLTVGAGVFPHPDLGRTWAKLDIVRVRARNKRTTCGDCMAGPQCGHNYMPRGERLIYSVAGIRAQYLPAVGFRRSTARIVRYAESPL